MLPRHYCPASTRGYYRLVTILLAGARKDSRLGITSFVSADFWWGTSLLGPLLVNCMPCCRTCPTAELFNYKPRIVAFLWRSELIQILRGRTLGSTEGDGLLRRAHVCDCFSNLFPDYFRHGLAYSVYFVRTQAVHVTASMSSMRR